MRKKFLGLFVLAFALNLKFVQSPVAYASYLEDDIFLKFRGSMLPHTYMDFAYIANGERNMLEDLMKWYYDNIERNYYRPNYVVISAIKHVVGIRIKNLVIYERMSGHNLSKHTDEIELIKRANIVIKKLGGTDADIIRVEDFSEVV